MIHKYKKLLINWRKSRRKVKSPFRVLYRISMDLGVLVIWESEDVFLINDPWAHRIVVVREVNNLVLLDYF